MSGHYVPMIAGDGQIEAVGSDGPTVRFAVGGDSAEIIRLAGSMYGSMGVDPSGQRWQRAAAGALAERLGRDVAVFVVDDPTEAGRLAAGGAASITTRLPGPLNPDGKVGYIQWISTDPRWRRHGMARAITSALVAWLRDRGVGSIELHATPDGEPLYRSLGFDHGPNPALRVRV